MTTESDMKINYALVLKQLQAELDGLEERRQALAASIAAMSRLVEKDPDDDETQPEHVPESVRRVFLSADPAMSTVTMPIIPPGFFSGKAPTQAYRELVQMWPGFYTPPQIADLFIRGGMSHKSRTDLVQAIHAVLKREKKRQQASLSLSPRHG